MLPDPGVEIVTTQRRSAQGANTTDLVVNNPTGRPWPTPTSSWSSSTSAARSSVRCAAHPYPAAWPDRARPVTWDTADFDPAYDPAQDYIVMAFWTDYQGNILDTAGRPLSSFQADPKPAFAMAAADETWDFGTAQQGTLMQRQFALASSGYMDLLTYIGSAAGLDRDRPAATGCRPADMGVYTVTLNTQSLPAGPYRQHHHHPHQRPGTTRPAPSPSAARSPPCRRTRPAARCCGRWTGR